MFKKIFSIIITVLLFIISILIFWERFYPETFYRSIYTYPIISELTNNNPSDFSEIGIATSSASIVGTSGRVSVKKNTWVVEIVKSELARENGLSNRLVLRQQQGMFFVFDAMDKHLFWMKNMLFPLDIIFIDDQWKIVEIDSNVASNSYPNSFGGKVKSQYVLEINAGEAELYNLKIGDKVSLSQN
ncbi:MAG: DUF192 domain-containing protein [bacterium]